MSETRDEEPRTGMAGEIPVNADAAVLCVGEL
jgi:hypothetical protein